jgi:hypothetical protein
MDLPIGLSATGKALWVYDPKVADVDGGVHVRKAWGVRGIGDDWNAIRIIALSQSNPLKAIAKFVEDSIDARASGTPAASVAGAGHAQRHHWQ